MDTLDCRGLSCPEPVLRVKQALQKSKELTVLLDNPIALENVQRLANKMGLKISLTENSGEYQLSLKK